MKIATKKIVLSAMFLSLGLLLPFITMQIPQVGKLLAPMHLPVMLCGYICGWPYGLTVGFITPLLRSFLFGMPVLYPKAVGMAFELAVYGLVCGLLYKLLPKKKISIYLSLLASMIAGRLAYGGVRFLLLGLYETEFNFLMWWTGSFLEAVPGLILQIVLIPLVVMALEKAKLLPIKGL